MIGDTYFDKYINYNFKVIFSNIPISVRGGVLLLFCLGTISLLAFLGIRKGLKWSARLAILEYLVLLIIVSVLARKVQADRLYCFTPFWSYLSILNGNRYLLIQIIANVIAFIPIGLLLGISFPNIKWWNVLLIGGAFSLLIETLQFLLRRGFAEFDDVFHNMLGCMIGYGVYVGIVYLAKRVKRIRVFDER